MDLLPPYKEREVDLMETKGGFRFPSILRHYLVSISREAICMFFGEEFYYGERRRCGPFLITGRASLRELSGTEHRVIHLSDDDMVVVSDDRHGQVVSSDPSFLSKNCYVECIANYLYRVRSDEFLKSLRDKTSDHIGFQSLIDANGRRCRRAGLTNFQVPEELRRHKRSTKTIVKVLHHCKTLDRFEIIDRDRKSKAASVIQRAWWTYWLKPGRKGVEIIGEHFRASCGVMDV